MRLHAVVTRRCPFCRYTVNTLVDREGSPAYRDGDISVCPHCCGLSVLEGRRLRLPTPPELAHAMRDRELLYSIKQLRAQRDGWSVF